MSEHPIAIIMDNVRKGFWRNKHNLNDLRKINYIEIFVVNSALGQVIFSLIGDLTIFLIPMSVILWKRC